MLNLNKWGVYKINPVYIEKYKTVIKHCILVGNQIHNEKRTIVGYDIIKREVIFFEPYSININELQNYLCQCNEAEKTVIQLCLKKQAERIIR